MSDETKPTADEEEAVAKTAALVTYVVQMWTDNTTSMLGAEEETPETTRLKDCWTDLGTVKVPPRTKRRTVCETALKNAGIKPGETSKRLRALDVDSAEVLVFEPHQPDPEWRAA